MPRFKDVEASTFLGQLKTPLPKKLTFADISKVRGDLAPEGLQQMAGAGFRAAADRYAQAV